MSDNDLWHACADPLIGDILRWNEPLWAEPNKPRGRPDKIGEQCLTARLLSKADVWGLEVLSVEKISSGEAPLKVKAGDTIRRKATSIALGDCHKCTQQEI